MTLQGGRALRLEVGVSGGFDEKRLSHKTSLKVGKTRPLAKQSACEYCTCELGCHFAPQLPLSMESLQAVF